MIGKGNENEVELHFNYFDLGGLLNGQGIAPGGALCEAPNGFQKHLPGAA